MYYVLKDPDWFILTQQCPKPQGWACSREWFEYWSLLPKITWDGLLFHKEARG